MRDNGKMTCSMDWELRSGLMAQVILVSIILERSKEKEYTNGMMGLSTQETGLRTRSVG